MRNNQPSHIENLDEKKKKNRFLSMINLLLKDRAGLTGMIIFLLLIITALFSPSIAPHDPLDQNLREGRKPPAWAEGGDWKYPLGTDTLGRDQLSRIIYGSRVSLTVGLIGAIIACGIGLILGSIAGFAGGHVDTIIMSIVNLVLGLPYILFVIFIAAVMGRSLINVILIFGITDAPIFVRLTRGEVLRIRESGYVESAISIGSGWFRILFQHILPNLIGPVITLATIEMSAMIFYESGLGFLGLSVPPTIPSWGNMLASGRQYLTFHPWIATTPGFAIVITVLGLNLLGDWLRDVLDPRLRKVKK